MISFKHRSAVLIVAQLIYILTLGLWENFIDSPLIPVLLYVGLFGAGGFILANSKKWLMLYILITVFGISLSLKSEVKVIHAASIILLTFSHILLFKQIFSHILKPTTVLADRLLSGIAGYIWLGMFWALQLDWVHLETVEAIRNQTSGAFVEGRELLYYSFVTLTTLGYGDYAPITWLAKSLSIFTSLSGVLYLAVFVSAIVAASEFKRA